MLLLKNRFVWVNNTHFTTQWLNIYSFPKYYITMCQIFYNSEKPDTFVYLMGMWFGEKHTICTMGKEESLQLMVLGKLDSHMQNNEIGSLSYTMHKNQLKMDLNRRFETVKFLPLEGPQTHIQSFPQIKAKPQAKDGTVAPQERNLTSPPGYRYRYFSSSRSANSSGYCSWISA